MDLLELVEDGGTASVHAMNHDITRGTLSLLLARPNVPNPYGTLTFSKVERLRVEIDTDEDGEDAHIAAAELLLGITAMPDSEYPNFWILTDQREITFNSAAEPVWTPTIG